MAVEPLHLKYRPKKFEDMIGNDATLQSLISVVRREEGRQHAYMFYGPSGCGKTTLGRILKDELGCSDEEFREYNTANTRGIETIRQIAQECRYAPVWGKLRVYLMDECHKLTNDAQNALLKLLEDTPGHVYFILCPTDPEKMIKTIRTRCAGFPVAALTFQHLSKLVRQVAQREGVTISREVVSKIASSSQGSPRQALVFLDTVIDMDDDNSALAAIENAVAGEASVIELCRELIANRNPKRWENMSRILQTLETNAEPEQIRYAVLGYFQSVLLKNPDDRPAQIMMLFFDSYMYTGKAGLVHSCYLASKI